MLRICDVCGQVDDHPRHVIGFEPDTIQPNTEMAVKVSERDDLEYEDKLRIVQDILDTTLMLRHMDCCRSVGCPTGDCNSVPDLKGDELRTHIVGGN